MTCWVCSSKDHESPSDDRSTVLAFNFLFFFDGGFVFSRLPSLNVLILEGLFCELQFFGRWTRVFRELNAELELWHSSVSERLSNLLANWSLLPNGVLATFALISLSECSPVALPCARFGMFWNKPSGWFWSRLAGLIRRFLSSMKWKKWFGVQLQFFLDVGLYGTVCPHNFHWCILQPWWRMENTVQGPSCNIRGTINKGIETLSLSFGDISQGNNGYLG